MEDNGMVMPGAKRQKVAGPERHPGAPESITAVSKESRGAASVVAANLLVAFGPIPEACGGPISEADGATAAVVSSLSGGMLTGSATSGSGSELSKGWQAGAGGAGRILSEEKREAGEKRSHSPDSSSNEVAMLFSGARQLTFSDLAEQAASGFFSIAVSQGRKKARLASCGQYRQQATSGIPSASTDRGSSTPGAVRRQRLTAAAAAAAAATDYDADDEDAEESRDRAANDDSDGDCPDDVPWQPRSLDRLLEAPCTQTGLRLVNFIVYCAALLEHVAYCVGGGAEQCCHRPTCVSLRGLVQHCRVCMSGLASGCWHCRAVATVAGWHSDRCCRADCAVPFCRGRLGSGGSSDQLGGGSSGQLSQVQQQQQGGFTIDALWRNPVVTMDCAFGLSTRMVGSFSQMADPVGAAIVRMLLRAVGWPPACELLSPPAACDSIDPHSQAGPTSSVLQQQQELPLTLIQVIAEARWTETCNVILHWLTAVRACTCSRCCCVATVARAPRLANDGLLGYVDETGHLLMQERDGELGIAQCLAMLMHVHTCQCSAARFCAFPLAYPLRHRIRTHESRCRAAATTQCQADRCITALWFFHALRCDAFGCPFPWCGMLRWRLSTIRTGACTKLC